MTIEEARRHQIGTDIKGSTRGSTATARRPRDGRDTPASASDIDEAPVGEAAMGRESVDRHDSFRC
jgi:hypothetical protein